MPITPPLIVSLGVTIAVIAIFPLLAGYIVLLKEDIIPTDADQAIFWFAPIISTFTALSAFSVLPLSNWLYVADVNVGLLVILAMSSVGILGIILGGWS